MTGHFYRYIPLRDSFSAIVEYVRYNMNQLEKELEKERVTFTSTRIYYKILQTIDI